MGDNPRDAGDHVEPRGSDGRPESGDDACAPAALPVRTRRVVDVDVLSTQVAAQHVGEARERLSAEEGRSVVVPVDDVDAFLRAVQEEFRERMRDKTGGVVHLLLEGPALKSQT